MTDAEDAIRQDGRQVTDLVLARARHDPTLALAITAYITTTLLERLPRDMRRGIATALIAPLAQGRRLDA